MVKDTNQECIIVMHFCMSIASLVPRPHSLMRKKQSVNQAQEIQLCSQDRFVPEGVHELGTRI